MRKQKIFLTFFLFGFYQIEKSNFWPKNNKHQIKSTLNHSKPLKLYTNRFFFTMRNICCKLTGTIFYSSKDTCEKHEILNAARFSHIFNFKTHLMPFKHDGFFKKDFDSFN